MEWLVLILPYVDKLFAICLDKVSTETPKEYLTPYFDEVSGTMDPDIVEDAMQQTRRAIRKAHARTRGDQRRNFPKYSRDEIYKITENRLIDAMNATDAQLAAARSGSAAIPDEE